MAINVNVGGNPHVVPETGETGWGNAVTSILVDIANLKMDFPLTADLDLGATFGVKSIFFKSRSTNPSSSGILRLSTSDTITWRNVANNADLVLTVNGSDQLTYEGNVIGGSASWGTIVGTLADQIDLKAALDGKEPIFSKNTGFNLNLGTAVGTVAIGNHTHAGVYEPANSNIQAHIANVANPHNTTLNLITDVILTASVVGNVLRYNGTNWVNYADSNYATAAQGTKADSAAQPGDNVSIFVNDSGYITGLGSQVLNDIGDVTIAAVADNEVLAYDTGTNKWINQTASEAGLATAGHTHVKANITDFTEGDYVHTTGVESIGGNKTFANDIVITGNLTVNGTTTTVNSETVAIADNILELNSNVTGAPTENGGIEIQRGTSTNSTVLWNETSNEWEIGTVGSTNAIGLKVHTHPTSDVVSGVFADARIQLSNVTQYVGSINHNLLLNYSANRHIDWVVTGAENIHVDRISQASVTQHQAALVLTASQISDFSTRFNTEIGTTFINELFDVVVSSPNTTHALMWNGSNWVNSTPKSNSLRYTVTQAAHGFVTGDVVYHDGVQWQKAQADSVTTLGIAIVDKVDSNTFYAVLSGIINGVVKATGWYYVSPTTPGVVTLTEPSGAGEFSNPIYFSPGGSEIWVFPYRAIEATGSVDHGTLGGLADDDHTQYHTDARAVTWIGTQSINAHSDVVLTAPANTEVLQYNGANWVNVPSSNVGVTDHTNLTSIGTNTHAQIDSHIADGTLHRIINDAGSSTTVLWSASKIIAQLVLKETAFSKNTGFNLNLGTAGGTVSEGNHTHSDPTRISESVTQATHGFSTGNAIYFNGTIWVKAQSNAVGTVGTHIADVADVNNFNAVHVGDVSGLSGLTPGAWYYVSGTVAGAITSTEPTTGYSNPIGYAESTTQLHVVSYRASDTAVVGSAVNDMSDATISSPADNEIFAYDNGTSEWINQTPAEAGLSAVGHTHVEADITDLQSYLVDLTTSPIGELSDVGFTWGNTDKRFLAYDTGTNKWNNLFQLNDSGVTAQDIWSANKITASLSGKEASFSKNTGFNLNLGTAGGTVSEGNHTHATVDPTRVSESVTQASHGFSTGNAIYHNGTTWAKAQSNASTTIGTHIADVADVNNFNAVHLGDVTGLTGLTAGAWYYVSGTVAGDITSTEPTTGYSNPVGYAESTTQLHVVSYRATDTAAATMAINDLSDVTITGAVKGDMLVYNGSAWIDLTVGANDEVLTADSAQASGVKWAAAAGGGTINVFQATNSADQTISGTVRANLNTSVRMDAGYTFSGNRVTVLNAGWYEVSYNFLIYRTSNGPLWAVLRKNNSDVNGTKSGGVLSASGDGNMNSSIIINLAANDILDVFCIDTTGAGGVRGLGTSFTIKQID